MRETVLDRCPRATHDVVALDSPDLRFPAACRTWYCPVCGPRKAREKAAVIAWAEPERFVTLTNAPAGWQSLRKKVRALRHSLAQDGYPSEWAWTVELGKKTGMKHVHLLQHGEYVPQRKLQREWGAIVHIMRVTEAKGGAAYAMKEAMKLAGYVTKGTHEDLLNHLALNGGRGVHLSRRYLHGERSDDVWRKLHPPDDSHEWALVLKGQEVPRRPA